MATKKKSSSCKSPNQDALNMMHPSSEEQESRVYVQNRRFTSYKICVATKPIRGTWNWDLLCSSNVDILLKDIKFW